MSKSRLSTRFDDDRGVFERAVNERERRTGSSLIGYKVMRWDAVRGEAVSMANSRLRMKLRRGVVHEMPGAGIFLGATKQYVLDYYGHNDVNVLITYAFDPKDVLRGSLLDREPEIGVARAKVLDYELFDADLEPLPNPRSMSRGQS